MRAIGQRDIAPLDRTRDLTLVHLSTPARGREPLLENAELAVLLTRWFPGQIGDCYHVHEEQVGRKKTRGFTSRRSYGTRICGIPYLVSVALV